MLGQFRAIGTWYHYYAGPAQTLEGRQIPVPNPDYLVYTRREPVGVVAAVTPWNSPLLLMTWKLAPALAAGCTVVVKPSEHAPASTLGFAGLIGRAGFPPGVVNIVTGHSRETGEHLVAHPGVDKVAFTGSTAAGRAVARAARVSAWETPSTPPPRWARSPTGLSTRRCSTTSARPQRRGRPSPTAVSTTHSAATL